MPASLPRCAAALTLCPAGDGDAATACYVSRLTEPGQLPWVLDLQRSFAAAPSASWRPLPARRSRLLQMPERGAALRACSETCVPDPVGPAGRPIGPACQPNASATSRWSVGAAGAGFFIFSGRATQKNPPFFFFPPRGTGEGRSSGGAAGSNPAGPVTTICEGSLSMAASMPRLDAGSSGLLQTLNVPIPAVPWMGRHDDGQNLLGGQEGRRSRPRGPVDRHEGAPGCFQQQRPLAASGCVKCARDGAVGRSAAVNLRSRAGG